MSTPTERPSDAATSRTWAARSACIAGVPWAALRRTTSAPASRIDRIASVVVVAGPRVAMIFVRRITVIIGRSSVSCVDRIVISGLRELGVHGVLPEEQVRAQPFEVDLELYLDLRAAGDNDDLAATVDYGAVGEAVARVVRDEHHQLLERLATRIAQVCREDGRVQRVVVEVRKLRPPVPTMVDHVAVRIER